MDELPDAQNDEDCPYSWLNEWLCEYVDGTMDPSLEAVFEEYIEANPDLKAHIERLKHTRDLLGQCREEPPPDAPAEAVCARVRRQVETEMLCATDSVAEVIAKRPLAALTSTMAVALVVGLFAGATLLAPSDSATSSPEASTAATESIESIERAVRSNRSSELARVSRSWNQPAVAPLRSTEVNMSSYASQTESEQRLPPAAAFDSAQHDRPWISTSQP